MKNKKHKRILILLIIVAIILSGYFIVVQPLNAENEALRDLSYETLPLNSIEDGTYIGQYETTLIKVEIQVTIVNHQITDLVLLKHDTGLGKPAEEILLTVLQEQSIEVDTIAGATYSSICILKSIEDALVDE